MKIMFRIVSLTFVSLLFVQSCIKLDSFCSGSFCNCANYDFAISSVDIMKSLKEIKRKSPEMDVVKYVDATNEFKSLDNYTKSHIVCYHFNIYDDSYNCIINCAINLGSDGNGFKKGCIHVMGYTFPHKRDPIMKNNVLANGSKSVYFDDYVITRLNKEENITMPDTVVICTEKFMKKIGPFKRAY